jgi:hypothetical protein
MNDPVFSFALLAAAFAFVGSALVVVGMIRGHRRLNKLPSTEGDVRKLARAASSPWDPLSETGSRRWRLVLLLAFWAIAIAGFVIVKRHNERNEPRLHSVGR